MWTPSASNFSYDELPSVMSYLHDRGVKGFVALNVLVFDSELPQLEDRARKLAEAGVDAVIVQVGACVLRIGGKVALGQEAGGGGRGHRTCAGGVHVHQPPLHVQSCRVALCPGTDLRDAGPLGTRLPITHRAGVRQSCFVVLPPACRCTAAPSTGSAQVRHSKQLNISIHAI